MGSTDPLSWVKPCQAMSSPHRWPLGQLCFLGTLQLGSEWMAISLGKIDGISLVMIFYS